MLRFVSRHRPSRATMLAAVALIVALGGTNAYATVKTFMLGSTNTSDAPTTVSASTTAWPTTGSQRLLQLTNLNTTGGATALGLNVAAGHPPFTVNSGTKVVNLNADKLDGVDSSSFVQGPGQILSNALAPAPGGDVTVLSVPGRFHIEFLCATTLSNSSDFWFVNDYNGQANLFADLESNSDPIYTSLSTGAQFNTQGFIAAPQGTSVTFQFQTSDPQRHVATVWFFSVNRPDQGNCHVEAQALIGN
jgi:hypothetical protein